MFTPRSEPTTRFHILAFPGPYCSTIDRATDDNGALGKLRDYFPGAGANSTPKEAINNLAACLSGGGPKQAFICGHGNVGFIGCGGGQHSAYEQCIGAFNEEVWVPDIPQLRKKTPVLTLLGCETGAEAEGLRLLARVSELTGLIVRAPTGLFSCDGQTISYEGKVQVVFPGQPLPPVIHKPHYVFSMLGEPIILFTDDGKVAVEPSSIAKVEIESFPSPQDKGSSIRKLAFDGTDTERIAGWARWSKPFRHKGEFLAIETGTLRLWLTHPNEIVKEFRIYNDRLLQDRSIPNVYYWLTDEFSKIAR